MRGDKHCLGGMQTEVVVVVVAAAAAAVVVVMVVAGVAVAGVGAWEFGE